MIYDFSYQKICNFVVKIFILVSWGDLRYLGYSMRIYTIHVSLLIYSLFYISLLMAISNRSQCGAVIFAFSQLRVILNKIQS